MLLSGLCFQDLLESNIIIKVNIWLLEHFVQMVPLVLVRIIVGGGSLRYRRDGV